MTPASSSRADVLAPLDLELRKMRKRGDVMNLPMSPLSRPFRKLSPVSLCVLV